jgi:hypothetical protein
LTGKALVTSSERGFLGELGMKKIYERPSLVKKGRLSAVTAQVASSTQPPPLT